MTDELRLRLDNIENATDQRLRLTFGYGDADGNVTSRTVRPLGLWFWGNVWTLVCWCEMRDDFRVFRLDRIHEMTTGDPFKAEREKSLTTYFARETAAGRIPSSMK